MAAHENVSARAMYDVIVSSILSQNISNSYHRQTLALLKDLGGEFKGVALGLAGSKSTNLRAKDRKRPDFRENLDLKQLRINKKSEK